MPLYELTCKRCGQTQEKFLWEQEDPEREPCSHCGGANQEVVTLGDYAWEYISAIGCG